MYFKFNHTTTRMQNFIILSFTVTRKKMTYKSFTRIFDEKSHRKSLFLTKACATFRSCDFSIPRHVPPSTQKAMGFFLTSKPGLEGGRGAWGGCFTLSVNHFLGNGKWMGMVNGNFAYFGYDLTILPVTSLRKLESWKIKFEFLLLTSQINSPKYNHFYVFSLPVLYAT